jgi:hypothetical protein
MEPASRTRLIALAVLLAISVPLVVIAAGGGSDEPSPDGLRIEPSKLRRPEIVVYVQDVSMNKPETAGGASRILMACRDSDGADVFQRRVRWPFKDTDGGKFDPHVHVLVEDPDVLGRIARCELLGTDPHLEGGRPTRR